jgi:hypothetical protein
VVAEAALLRNAAGLAANTLVATFSIEKKNAESPGDFNLGQRNEHKLNSRPTFAGAVWQDASPAQVGPVAWISRGNPRNLYRRRTRLTKQ